VEREDIANIHTDSMAMIGTFHIRGKYIKFYNNYSRIFAVLTKPRQLALSSENPKQFPSSELL
jgi:hypothetical protein